MGLSNKPYWNKNNLKEISMGSKVLTQTYPHAYIGINIVSPYINKGWNHDEAGKFKMETY